MVAPCPSAAHRAEKRASRHFDFMRAARDGLKGRDRVARAAISRVVENDKSRIAESKGADLVEQRVVRDLDRPGAVQVDDCVGIAGLVGRLVELPVDEFRVQGIVAERKRSGLPARRVPDRRTAERLVGRHVRRHDEGRVRLEAETLRRRVRRAEDVGRRAVRHDQVVDRVLSLEVDGRGRALGLRAEDHRVAQLAAERVIRSVRPHAGNLVLLPVRGVVPYTVKRGACPVVDARRSRKAEACQQAEGHASCNPIYPCKYHDSILPLTNFVDRFFYSRAKTLHSERVRSRGDRAGRRRSPCGR